MIPPWTDRPFRGDAGGSTNLAALSVDDRAASQVHQGECRDGENSATDKDQCRVLSTLAVELVFGLGDWSVDVAGVARDSEVQDRRSTPSTSIELMYDRGVRCQSRDREDSSGDDAANFGRLHHLKNLSGWEPS